MKTARQISIRTQRMPRRLFFIISTVFLFVQQPSFALEKPIKVVFDGVRAEHKWTLKELNPQWPSDWNSWQYLVMEMRFSSPQRFFLWAYTPQGRGRIVMQPFGQGVWLRVSIPLRYFKGRDEKGMDLASANNRRTNSYWFSLWGPFTDLKNVEAISVSMDYPLDKPVLEIRSIELSNEDKGSEFIEPDKMPVVDEFGQWAHADWPGKIKSKEQLQKELADEEKTLAPGDFGYCKYGGYKNTNAKTTGFFHVEQIDGKWWFVDPDGHLFLSTGSNGLGRMRGRGGNPPPMAQNTGPDLTTRRLEAWGMNTGGQGRPYTMQLRWPRDPNTSFLGLPDVYSQKFAQTIDQSAADQCTPRRNDAMLIGYFVGNEPPWPERESEVADMILAGPDTATKAKLKMFLAQGDTPLRREQFIIEAFEKYLDVICSAAKKYDPNHLNLGIRFGSSPPEKVLRTGHIFDICSINIYEYEPAKAMERTYRITGRPVLIGEFHLGVPANGLAAGLVQAQNQTERGKGYRYYVEQAAKLPCFLGVHWFTWRDEPVLGRFDGENYNIGFVDATDRPYRELVAAAKETHKRLYEVHAGKAKPFDQRPKASAAGTPDSPWN